MAKQVVQYIAEDGTTFDTEEAANAHDKAVAYASSVKEYAELAGLEKMQISLLRKHIPAFLAFTEDGIVPEKHVKKPRKPRTPKAAA